MRPRQPRAILHDEIAQRRTMAAHLERKHGAPGDLERHPLHRFAEIDRLAAGCPEFGNRLVGHRDHVRNKRRNGARRKGRRQRPSLVLPRATLGDQQAFAEHRTQHPEAGRRSRVVLVIVDQHMPDRIRRVENKTAVPEEAALEDILFVSPLSPGADHALAHRHQPPEEGHGFGRARRAGRHQRLTRDGHVPGFGYAH